MRFGFRRSFFQKECTIISTWLSCRVNFDSCCHLAWSKIGRLERREENYKQKRWLQGWLLKKRIVQKDQPGVWRLHKTRFIVVCAIHCWISISFSMPLLSAHCTATQIDLHHSRLMYFYPSSASFLSLNLRHSVIHAKEEEQTLFVMVRMVTIFLFETTANITATAANLNLLVCGWQALAGRGSWRAG